METDSLFPNIALAAYAEPFVDGKRIVIFGDSTSGLAEHLVDRGARLVHVYDAELSRVSEAAARGMSRNISYAPLGQAGIAVRDGAFDFAILENLAAGTDGKELMKRLARSLGPRGVAMVAIPNPDVKLRLIPDGGQAEGRTSLGYYELYDQVAEHFSEVRMLGQLPFVGYALADFSPDAEAEISVDTGFLPGGSEEPEWFVALASQEPLQVDAFSIVQLPFSQVLRRGQDQTLETSARRAKAQEQAALGRVAQLEAELATLRQQKQEGQHKQQTAESSLKQQLLELKEQLQKREAWAAQLEARAATADSRADEAEAEVDKLRRESEASRAKQQGQQAQENSRSVALQTERQALVAEQQKLVSNWQAEQKALLAEQEKRSAAWQAEKKALLAQQEKHSAGWLAERQALVAEQQKLKQETESKLRGLEEQLAQALSTLEEQKQELARPKTDFSPDDEIAALEAQLKNRAEHIATLESDLGKTERIASELARELAALAQSSTAPATTVESRDDSREVAELKQKLDKLAQANAEREARLTAADWALRELKSRPAAPSEADLARELELARSEIQRQKALLSQLEPGALNLS